MFVQFSPASSINLDKIPYYGRHLLIEMLKKIARVWDPFVLSRDNKTKLTVINVAKVYFYENVYNLILKKQMDLNKLTLISI